MNAEPAILGEHGEGYCRHCRFVVALTPGGRLVTHYRKGERCDGSLKAPAKVTPYSSRKSAFSTRAPVVECPVCKRRVKLMDDGRMTSSGHDKAQREYGFSNCQGAWRRPDEVVA